MARIDRLCVFCGSSRGARPDYADALREVGRLLAGRGITLVYGGGKVGLMGILADAVLDAGGEVVGVLPQAAGLHEVAHRGLSDLRMVGSMHERKALMVELSDAFIAAPGGLGTLDETFEVLTWSQLGLHRKPVGILDVGGYFAPLLEFLDASVRERFVKPVHRDALLAAADPGALLARLEAWQPVGERKIDAELLSGAR